MARQAFRFSLEPEMLRLEAQLDDAERRTAEARAALEHAQVELATRRHAAEETVQHLAAARENQARRLVGATHPTELCDHADHLRGLERRREERLAAIDAWLPELRRAHHRHESRKRALDELVLRRESLEKARKRQLAAHRAEERSREEARVEDAAIQAWSWRQGSESHESHREHDEPLGESPDPA